MRMCIGLGALTLLLLSAIAQNDMDSLLDLSLEELQDVRVTAGTVIPTTERLKPAAVTHIEAREIRQSGARHLNELFDIYVPNMQLMRHEFEQSQVGTRAIFGAFGDKHLLLINGRLINHVGKQGALSERDLPLMGDIRSIDYVRGPGAVVYGPGALGGVIAIETHDGLSFEGTDLTLQQGFIEGYTALELRHAMKLGPRRGLFVYYGLADYQGADQDDAPLIFGRSSGTRGNGPAIVAGEPVDFDIVNDHDAHRAQLEHKFHLHYSHNEFEAWMRYSRGGEKFAPIQRTVSLAPVGVATTSQTLDEAEGHSVGYQQLTLFAGYQHALAADWDLELALSYDIFDVERLHRVPSVTRLTLSYREEKVLARAIARWTPDADHKVALGAEFAHFWFGDGLGFPNTEATSNRQKPITDFWCSQMISLLAEHQWQISEKWATHIGLRGDLHSYTRWMYSPRAALIFSPTEQDSLKLLANQSVRRSSDDDLRVNHTTTGRSGIEEQLQSVELRYERQHSQALRTGVSIFLQNSEVVDFSQQASSTSLLGDYDSAGLEFEASYHTANTRISASHGFTKMLNFCLASETTTQGFSSEPYGYGDDLASWSNHVSKLALAHDFTPKWTGSASLRIYWGFDGAKDLAQYHNDRLAATGSRLGFLSLTDPGYEQAFKPNYYLNLGVEYRPNPRLTGRLDAYNILGWIDKDFNKRNFLVRSGDYRSEAAALGITLRYRF